MDADPDLAAPWHQLFRQVHSPPHVLSELLQNADDAGANLAKAYIQGQCFYFEHDGVDFSPEDFQSLCRFGLSNKRALHTIGFRGIGFKSLFSLGKRVELFTPTLSVAFERDHFTLPRWLGTGHTTGRTLFRIAVETPAQLSKIRSSLQEWKQSAIPLLFFNNIRTLTLDGAPISRNIVGKGPVPNSQLVLLSTNPQNPLLRIWSDAAELPPVCLEEIRDERGDPSIVLPPVRVEILMGTSFQSSLFVILPTNIKLDLPFACNAPFIQDPARRGIKDPSLSPTNRWMLKKIGSLAAKTLLSWVRNESLPLQDRARAYDLIPFPAANGRDSGLEVGSILATAFGGYIASEQGPQLLTTEGHCVSREHCLDLPAELLQVWPAKVLSELFGGPRGSILCESISTRGRDALIRWKFLEEKGPRWVYQRLASGISTPRPNSDDSLQALWAMLDRVLTKSWDPSISPPNGLAIVPVKNKQELFPAKEVVSMRGTVKDLPESDWLFLAQFARIVDPAWEARFNSASPSATTRMPSWEDEFQRATDLSRRLDLQARSGVAPIMEQAAHNIFTQSQPGEAGVQFARVALHAHLTLPKGFKYLRKDGSWRPPSETAIVGIPREAQELLPAKWLSAHLLADTYGFGRPSSLSASQWEQMQLHRFPLPASRITHLRSLEEVQRFCVQRGGHRPTAEMG